MKVHSLFLKIFLWFWVAMTLAGLSLLAMEARQSEQLTERWRRMVSEAFAVYADSAADAHEDNAQWESKEYLADLQQRTGIRAWLFDERHREVSGHARAPLVAYSRGMTEQMRELAARARDSGRTEFQPLETITLAARAAIPVNGRRYVLVGELPVARFGPWEAKPRVQALRLLAVLLAAAIVCWGLGRYLTHPIVTLRDATWRLAQGDLSVRPGAAIGRRRDELADLSRDFDGMAERIENLLEEQKRLVRAQRRLLGDVSHELRSPLARLGVALELARDCAGEKIHLSCGDSSGGAPINSLGDALSRIEHEAGHLSETIDRLLVLARMESGVQELERTPVDLAALVRAVAADADFEARSNRRAVRVTDCDDCTTHSTADLLRSAIENVVRNAVRYTPEGTTVEISLRREKSGKSNRASEAPSSLASSFAVITVRDRGPGVPEAELEDVFRPFYRVAGARDRKSGGDGLGLAITARAVHLHSGTVAASNVPGGGLIVTIRLPAADTTSISD